MSTIVADLRPSVPAEPAISEPNYINVSYGVKSWLLTVDHKRIGILYLLSITVMFFFGGLFAVLIRLELLTPKGDLFQADTYNKLFTMHGIVMLFFFLIPSIPSVLGDFLLPLMIGALRPSAFQNSTWRAGISASSALSSLFGRYSKAAWIRGGHFTLPTVPLIPTATSCWRQSA